MIKTDKNYIEGSAARKLEYDVYKENKVLNRKKKQRLNNKIKVKVVFALFVIFLLSGLAMYRYALITDLNYKINTQMNEYTKIKNENIRLKVKIESELDLQTIKEIAEKKLGMQEPDKHQITRVQVPRNDFITVSEGINSEGKSDANIIDALLSKVDRLTRLLY